MQSCLLVLGFCSLARILHAVDGPFGVPKALNNCLWRWNHRYMTSCNTCFVYWVLWYLFATNMLLIYSLPRKHLGPVLLYVPQHSLRVQCTNFAQLVVYRFSMGSFCSISDTLPYRPSWYITETSGVLWHALLLLHMKDVYTLSASSVKWEFSSCSCSSQIYSFCKELWAEELCVLVSCMNLSLIQHFPSNKHV